MASTFPTSFYYSGCPYLYAEPKDAKETVKMIEDFYKMLGTYAPNASVKQSEDLLDALEKMMHATQPAQPTQPSQPAQPTQPSQSAQPTQPSQPTQSTQFTQNQFSLDQFCDVLGQLLCDTKPTKPAEPTQTKSKTAERPVTSLEDAYVRSLLTPSEMELYNQLEVLMMHERNLKSARKDLEKKREAMQYYETAFANQARDCDQVRDKVRQLVEQYNVEHSANIDATLSAVLIDQSFAINKANEMLNKKIQKEKEANTAQSAPPPNYANAHEYPLV